jgi:hypothetical protein
MSEQMKPTFHGEVQLAGWSESHTSGCKVTFWLSDPGELEAFRAMTVRKGNASGQRLAMALVEIGDDEKPVQESGAFTQPEQTGLGPICKLAVQWCKDPMFMEWFIAPGEPKTEEACRVSMLHACGIESRRELDTNKHAADLFHKRIREPYAEWRKGNGH